MPRVSNERNDVNGLSDKLKKMSESRLITTALVFASGREKVIPINHFENFVPRNENDFKAGNKYKAWWNGTKDKDDYLFNVHILLLGSSEADILRQKNNKRLKYPNKRMLSFSSNIRGGEKATTSKKRTKRKVDVVKVNAKNQQNNTILRRHEELMKKRTRFDMSSEDEEMNELESDLSKKSKESSDLLEERNNDSLEENNGHSTPRHNESEDTEISSRSAGRSISYRSTNTVRISEDFQLDENNGYSTPLHNESEDTEISSRSAGRSISNRSTDTVRISEDFELDENNELMDQQTLLQMQSTNTQRQPAGSSNNGMERPERLEISTNSRRALSAIANYERFIQGEEDRVHLGLNYHVHRDVYDYMKRKNDSKFVRDLSLIFWGKETLKNKCLDKSKVRRGKENDASTEDAVREELTPEKVTLVQDLLYAKITEAGVTGVKLQARMKLSGKYLTDKINDVRRKL